LIWGTIPQSNDIKKLIVKEIHEIANITNNKIVTKNKSLLESKDSRVSLVKDACDCYLRSS